MSRVSSQVAGPVRVVETQRVAPSTVFGKWKDLKSKVKIFYTTYGTWTSWPRRGTLRGRDRDTWEPVTRQSLDTSSRRTLGRRACDQSDVDPSPPGGPYPLTPLVDSTCVDSSILPKGQPPASLVEGPGIR